MRRDYHVVYLTGAPAAGKSTLAAVLEREVTPLLVFEYGRELANYLQRVHSAPVHQQDLRARSSHLASVEDIEALDNILLELVARERQRTHIVIDTHAVTKEDYGFRITPFSVRRIELLAPTMILMLYTPPDVALERIKKSPDGRPEITAWEAGFHTALQASVATAYSTQLGVPVYLFYSARDLASLSHEVTRRLARQPRSTFEGLGRTNGERKQ